jgi:putative DNA primase/helicase
MNQNAIPQELKQLPQWVTWQFEKEGKPVSKDTEGATKIPYNARTGHKASSTNPNTWTEFAVAVQAAKQRQHSGVGFVFSETDPFTGIDLDDCIDPDGSLQPWALDIVTTMDSYTEISPSGTGVKIWVEGEIPSSIKTPQIEMYFKARYFTVTGQHYDSTPTTIRNVNGALSRLYDSVKKEAPAPTPAPTAHATIGDDHARAGRSANSLTPFAWLCRHRTA